MIKVKMGVLLSIKNKPPLDSSHMIKVKAHALGKRHGFNLYNQILVVTSHAGR
jgi:hypothetical protein